MRTHAVWAVALLTLLAGCGAIGGGPDGTAAETPEATATATADPCATDLLITADGTADATPAPLPDEPSSFSAESVGEFTQRYERAFANNHELGERVRDVAVELQGTSVKTVEGGHLVRIHVWTRVEVGTPTDGGGEVETRESFYDAHYFVSESVLRRAETERHGTLPDTDLSSSGITLACWDG